MAHPPSIFASMKAADRHIVRMRDVQFEPSLFRNYLTGTALDELLCSYKGLPKGVNYMVIGDPGVGKTTVIMDMLSDIRMLSTAARVLFISAEMNEIDLAVYVQRFPKFKDVDILFIKADFSSGGGGAHCLELLTDIFSSGWDVVAIDSFYELQGIIKEEENITLKKAESLLLSLLKEQNEGHNDLGANTTVTKSGNFIGSNRLKHYITAMMELRLENPKNVYSSRYVVFTKHRRGTVGIRLYYDLGVEGDVFYDEKRFRQDQQIRSLQSKASDSIRDVADRFDKLFSNIEI